MSRIGNDALIHLKQFANHKNVEIAAVSKKSALMGGKIIVLKKLDIAHLPSEKLRKYHQEGRLAFILDNQQVQFNQTFAKKNLADLSVCNLKMAGTEILEGVSIGILNQEEYDEIVGVCQEVLASMTESKKESIQSKVTSGIDSLLHLDLRHLFIRNIINITKHIIESMETHREEEREQDKTDAKKQQLLRERLNLERLSQEISKYEIEKQNLGKVKNSDEKRATLEKKTGNPIAEHQA